MKHHAKDPRGAPTATAIVLALCEGPRTPAQLAEHFGCRPSCLGHALGLLRSLKLLRYLRDPRSAGPASPSKLELAIDPVAAFALVRGVIEIRQKIPEKRLHGSVEFLHNEAARQGGATPDSDCAPPGVPLGACPASGQNIQ
jgi:hypothetical protein